MTATKEEIEYVSYIVELMQSIGPVYAKRMFGGHGIFLDSLMFGLITDGTLYLKADQETVPAFEARGHGAFSYAKKDRTYTLSYYQAPEETLENQEDMATWANQAYAVALKAHSNKIK